MSFGVYGFTKDTASPVPGNPPERIVRGGGRKGDHAVLIKFPQLLRNFNAVGTAHEEGLLAGSLQKGFAALKLHNLRLNATLH